ncbi:MAG: hypothetical protein Q7S12_01330 [bacterium]|nr:hypothetical protein [bacterium]
MIYFLYGESSYHALRKINDFKNAFVKKNKGVLIEEYDGESEEISLEKFHGALGQANLFSKTRLVIFKNALGEEKKITDELKDNGEFLKNSKDVFVFWEKEPEAKVITFFKKHSEKIQEVRGQNAADLDKWLDKKAQSLGLKLEKNERAIMIDEAGEQAEWALEGELEKLVLSERQPKAQVLQDLAQRDGASRAIPQQRDMRVLAKSGAEAKAPSPFVFIDKMFGLRALLALKEMSLAGIEPQKFIYAFLWKLKQKRMPDAYFAGIEAESQIRRDPKNAEEILEKFIFSISKK